MTSLVQVVRSFDAAPATVFDAWVAPTTLIGPVTSVAMDPVVGGELRLAVGGSAGDELTGRFLVAERPTRLLYTWRWGRSVEETIIDVSFNEAGTSTVVEVEHRGFVDDTSRATHLRGWIDYLDGLSAFL